MHPNGTVLWTSGEYIQPLPHYQTPEILLSFNIVAHAKYTNTKPGEAIYMFIMSYTSDKDPKELQGPAILSDLKRRALPFADPFKQALLPIPDDSLCSHSRLSYWPTEPWDSRHGTVALAGDAAHPMTFRTSRFCFLTPTLSSLQSTDNL